MQDREGKYNVKAVSKLLGIQPGTLRAWERRYKIITPSRNNAGHRLYTEEQVIKLRWLMMKVQQGFTIGQAVDLLETESIIGGSFIEDTKEINQMDTLKSELLHYLLRFNEYEGNLILDRAFSMFSLEKVVIEILGEVLVDVGDLWEKNRISSAHEHFVTSYIRTRIGMVIHHLPVINTAPKVISICSPGEKHELGLLIFTLFLKRRGYNTIYFGCGLPLYDIVKVIDEINPKMIFISCTMQENLPHALELIQMLNSQNPKIQVGIGGQAFNTFKKIPEKLNKEYFVGKNEEEWASWLIKVNDNSL